MTFAEIAAAFGNTPETLARYGTPAPSVNRRETELDRIAAAFGNTPETLARYGTPAPSVNRRNTRAGHGANAKQSQRPPPGIAFGADMPL